MNYKLNNIIMFVTGAAVGSVVTWKLVKTKYEQITQEAIDSVKEMYAKKALDDYTVEECVNTGLSVSVEETKERNALEEMRTEYASIAKAAGYTNNEGGDPMDIDRPYVISPEDFDTVDYNIECLDYYADGVLADEAGNPIEDIDNTVGIESLSRFGEFEQDTVYVRNDARQTDYEICRDASNYYTDDGDYPEEE